MASVTICSDFQAPKINSLTVSTVSPTICLEVIGLDAMVFVFWTLSLGQFFTLLFHFHQEALPFLFTSIKVVSFVFLRLLIFLLAILIPACSSLSPAFHKMYSTNKLNKWGDNIQPWRTPFWIWNQSIVPCPVLTVASWPAYRFLKRQIKWSGIPISFRISHSLLWSTQSKALVPGSSPGGSREFEAGMALAREKTYLFINIRLD